MDYKVYQPTYSLLDYIARNLAIGKTIIGAYSKIKNRRIERSVFGASVEITDRCNAGCSYCYVYDQSWDQNKRIRGYLELDPAKHREIEDGVFETLNQLKKQGIVHVTLVGGEPLLFPKAIYRAGKMFPVVYVVSNGSVKFPVDYPRSVVISVSIDGPPEYHNHARDPLGFFSKQSYRNLTGMSAYIVRNINNSQRGAYVHITLNRKSISLFPQAIDWFVKDIDKLRGVVVSGAATQTIEDPFTLTPDDRQVIKRMIEDAQAKYGKKLFPFNQPSVNNFLFDSEHIIKNHRECTVSRRVDSYDFSGRVVGKCVLRDTTNCETCVCNLTGLMRSVSRLDPPTLSGLYSTCFG
ncbi:MAG TPA: radical SAM protein [Stenomitos sp.]